MTAMILAMMLAGSSASMDSEFIYSATYGMSADVARDVEASSGHWIPPAERPVPVEAPAVAREIRHLR